jgi:uncharacterized protein YjiK
MEWSASGRTPDALRFRSQTMVNPFPLFVPFVLWLIVASCSRTQPETGNPAVPGLSQLQPIASYSLAAHAAEPSGIVYNPKNNSLLVVSDSHPEVYEFDLHGNYLRSITTVSTDLEGISLSETGDSLYIAEERNRKIVTYLMNGAKLSSFSADVATLTNNALEGVTVGPGGHLLVLNEKAPGMLLEYLPDGTEVRRTALSFASDYSDLFYDAAAGNLWIISDESMSVTRTDLTGTPLARWSIPFSKGEGISIVRDTMYIVNDTDAKMYVFVKPQ